MQFRKKPVVIEAVQLTREAIESHLFDAAPLPDGVRLASAKYHKDDRKIVHARFVIDTLEGTMTVSEGDWVITGVQGEHYPCKSDIFEQTYEPVEEYWREE